ncbi:hypothetical protein ACIQI8_00090 [Streptomyces sp. NPDC092369]|uniref:hypothetical protein n=1 Tax=Streptomyces sp. NPDC092369 TaxID=3366015 RepID=UPI00382C2B72
MKATDSVSSFWVSSAVIRAVGGDADLPAHAGDLDDRASALLTHRPQEGMDALTKESTAS